MAYKVEMWLDSQEWSVDRLTRLGNKCHRSHNILPQFLTDLHRLLNCSEARIAISPWLGSTWLGQPKRTCQFSTDKDLEREQFDARAPCWRKSGHVNPNWNLSHVRARILSVRVAVRPSDWPID